MLLFMINQINLMGVNEFKIRLIGVPGNNSSIWKDLNKAKNVKANR